MKQNWSSQRESRPTMAHHFSLWEILTSKGLHRSLCPSHPAQQLHRRDESKHSRFELSEMQNQMLSHQLELWAARKVLAKAKQLTEKSSSLKSLRESCWLLLIPASACYGSSINQVSQQYHIEYQLFLIDSFYGWGFHESGVRATLYPLDSWKLIVWRTTLDDAKSNCSTAHKA